MVFLFGKEGSLPTYHSGQHCLLYAYIYRRHIIYVHACIIKVTQLLVACIGSV